MKEIKDRKQLEQVMDAHHIKDIFNDALLPHLSLYGFDQGELICSQGDTSERLYILVSGKLKVFHTSPEGKKLIVSFKTPLEVIGDIEYVRGIELINTVKAISPVVMIGVHYQRLTRYSRDYAPLLQFLLDMITQKFCVKSHTMSLNLLYPVEVRVASYLLSVCFDETNVQFIGRLPVSDLKDAADLIGTSYRHLNRIIQQLSSEGWIERSKGYIHVKDREGLGRLSNHNIYEWSYSFSRKGDIT